MPETDQFDDINVYIAAWTDLVTADQGLRSDADRSMVTPSPLIIRPVVLVVEDEAIIRLEAVDLVGSAGFDVIEAANAGQAIGCLEQWSDIRILFTDIDMPGSIDGIGLATIVRDRWPSIKMIIVSGQETPSAETMPIGSLFFSKPYLDRDITSALLAFVY